MGERKRIRPTGVIFYHRPRLKSRVVHVRTINEHIMINDFVNIDVRKRSRVNSNRSKYKPIIAKPPNYHVSVTVYVRMSQSIYNTFFC